MEAGPSSGRASAGEGEGVRDGEGEKEIERRTRWVAVSGRIKRVASCCLHPQLVV